LSPSTLPRPAGDPPANTRTTDDRDLVITELADAEAALRAQATDLAHLLADLTFENAVLRRLFAWERLQRIHVEGMCRRLQRTRRPAHGQGQAVV
jgi:hypothetical protein